MNAVSTAHRYHCPTWCEGHDEDSIEQTAETHEVVHCSGVGGGATDRLSNMVSGRILRDEQMTWDVVCYMTEEESGVRQGEFVHLDLTDLRDHAKVSMPLTSGEARTVAAALLAAADRLEITHPYRQDQFHRYTGLSQHN